MTKGMDRRSFLQSAAVGVAAMAGAGMLTACSSGSDEAKAESAPTTTAPAPEEQPEKKKNRVCELLGIEKPVISAQMYNLTDAAFVAAVSEAGGFGLLNTANLGTEEISDPAEMLRVAREEIQKIKTLTDKPFGVACPYQNVSGFQELILEEMPMAVVPGYGMNVEELRDAGIKVIAIESAGSVVEVVRKNSASCDLMFVKSYGCGGHVPHSRENALSLMQKYANQGIEIPLIPGGGITNGLGAAAMARAGAEGVWVGTRFLVTEESPAHPKTKQAIIDLKADTMIEFRASTGGWLHTSDTPKAREILEMGLAGATADELAAAYMGVYLYGMRLGDLDNWMVNVSDSVDSITSMMTVKEVVDELGDAFLAAQA